MIWKIHPPRPEKAYTPPHLKSVGDVPRTSNPYKKSPLNVPQSPTNLKSVGDSTPNLKQRRGRRPRRPEIPHKPQIRRGRRPPHPEKSKTP